MYYVEFTSRALLMAGADPGDIGWARVERWFDTFDEADEEAFDLSIDDEPHVYRVVEESMTEYESVVLDTQCGVCGSQLELAEGGREHLVQCPECDADPGEGSTPADALQAWLARQPAPVYVPTAIAHFVLPKHPWVVEVDGYPFGSLSAAESYALKTGLPIYCRLASSQKAANE